MRVLGHTAVSLTIGAILYNYIDSLAGFLWFLTGAILIDADHYIDYAREHGISFNLRRIYATCKTPALFKQLVLILHSYELLIILWLSIVILKLNIMWNYAAIGFTFHMLIDQLTNPVLPLSYFILFRLSRNFQTDKVFITKGVEYAYWSR